MASAPSNRELMLRNPDTVARLYRIAHEDPAFRRFMGRALNSTIPCTEWKPYQRRGGAA